MKFANVLGILVICSTFQVAFCRPLEEAETKGGAGASVYVLGSLYNAAVSQDFSKSQAASDRNGSEWNSTEMQNGVAQTEYEEDMDRRGGKNGSKPRILIYAGGDASNVAIAYEASEAQAAENDKQSGYNSQSLGMNKDFAEGEGWGPEEEEEIEHSDKTKWP